MRAPRLEPRLRQSGYLGVCDVCGERLFSETMPGLRLLIDSHQMRMPMREHPVLITGSAPGSPVLQGREDVNVGRTSTCFPPGR